jgi:hypothetical protein
MGQLTNLYVSSSYQGLLKLTDSTTGLTPTLQTVQDGLGGNSPLQISQTEVNISGTFTVNGAPVSINTGSLVSTSSFNAYTSSVDLHLAGLDVETGSLQNQINSKLNTSSFNSYTSSNDSKVNSLISQTGSYVTETESGSFLITGSVAGDTLTFTKGNGSTFDLKVVVATGSLPAGVVSGSAQVAAFGYATTGSNTFNGTQTITGSVNVTGTVTATSASFQYVNTVYETASVIYSSGSNQFGDASNDTQTLWGKVSVPSGPVSVTGSVIATNFTGSLQGTASYATQALSASWAPDNSNRNGLITTGSISGTQAISGSLIVGVDITSRLLGTASYANNALSASYVSLPSGLVSGSSQISYTGITNVPSGIVSGSQQVTDLGFATTGSVNQKLDTGSFNSYTSSNDGKVNALIAATASYVTETESGSFMTTGSVAGNVLTFTKGNGTTFNLTVDTGSNSNRNGLITTGSIAGTQSITGSLILSGSAGVELDVKGDQSITGSLSVSGSIGVRADLFSNRGLDLNIRTNGGGNLDISTAMNTPIRLFGASSIQITGSLISSGSIIATGSIEISGSLGLSNQMYGLENGALWLGTKTSNISVAKTALTQSNVSSATNILMLPVGQPAAILSGSVLISGSNNILTAFGSSTPAAQGRKQIWGSNNIQLQGGVTVNTSSLTTPQVSNNILGNGITMTYTTGSNLGDNAHAVTNNIVFGNTTINHPSASIGAGQSSTFNFNIAAGSVTSNTPGPTVLTATANINNNIISNPTVTLNHNSSSIQFNQNLVGGNGFTINNRFYTTGSNNILAASANIIGGQAVVVNTAGAPATNTTRTLVGNLMGGGTVNVSLEANNSDTAGLRNSIVYGQGLNVSGSHSAASAAVNSITLIGRWNGEDNGLADSARTVFAVGTGTANGTRRTGLYVTSGSLVGVSGSLDIKGPSTLTGSLNVSGDVMFASGSNKTIGTFVLDGGNPGVASISNTLVTANSLIFLTKQTNTNSGNGTVSVTSKGIGTFSVTSNHNGDTDTVAYLIINPA